MIRSYRPDDLDAVYDICVRTAADGLDARGKYSDDRLIGDVFAAPYVVLEPEHAHILDDGEGRAVGYILGTADTQRFVERFRAEWLPVVTPRYDGNDDPRDQEVLHWLRTPERMLVPELTGHPAHLHIDLLPEWQGRGYGRGLMDALRAGLRKAGVEKVHLTMSATNDPARAFYRKLGFTEIEVPGSPPGTAFGRTTED